MRWQSSTHDLCVPQIASRMNQDSFVDIVSGRLKPASKGRFKTSHYES